MSEGEKLGTCDHGDNSAESSFLFPSHQKPHVQLVNCVNWREQPEQPPHVCHDCQDIVGGEQPASEGLSAEQWRKGAIECEAELAKLREELAKETNRANVNYGVADDYHEQIEKLREERDALIAKNKGELGLLLSKQSCGHNYQFSYRTLGKESHCSMCERERAESALAEARNKTLDEAAAKLVELANAPFLGAIASYTSAAKFVLALKGEQK